MKKDGIGFLACFAFSVAVTVGAQPGAGGRGDVFDYPVKPGTSGWDSLKTHAEMVEACQIPKSRLKEMSTEALIQTCMDHPLFPDMFAFNNLQEGFERVASRFNGLQEIMKRVDSGPKLLRYFKAMDPSDAGWRSMDFAYIEMLLTQDAVLATLPRSERVSLLKESYGKFAAKQNTAGNTAAFPKPPTYSSRRRR